MTRIGGIQSESIGIPLPVACYMFKSTFGAWPFAPATLIISLVAAVPGAAQNAPRPDSTQTDSAAILGNRPHKLDVVSVRAKKSVSPYSSDHTRTATKLPALPRDIPQSLTTVTGALARDQGMRGMSDVVRYIPGITMGQGEGNRDQPTIRGNGTTADFFVDGMRDDAQYFRDLYNVERIEALKGSNAMAFGRGGGGGVLNRITKEPHGVTSRELMAEGGSFGSRRVAADIQQRMNPWFSARLNSVYEDSDSFREGVSVDRSGFNPTIAFSTPRSSTRMSVGYEHFRDRRTADRGIPSLSGNPVHTNPSTFFGSADRSFSRMDVNAANVTLWHDAGRIQFRNRTVFSDYDKFYQNVYPASASESDVTLSAYNQAVGRQNFFNQTDATFHVATGGVRHDLVIGGELGIQDTKNVRATGLFGDSATTARVPLGDPTYRGGIAFRQNASDADNTTDVDTRSVYVLDQLSFGRRVRLIAGARYERFAVRFDDNRSDATRTRTDDMVSPRLGLVVKPSNTASLYASYSVSFLPGSGDQFTTLSEITKALEPERFENFEAGAKWDAMDRLALTVAAYRLDRTNSRSIDPTQPSRVIQTGAQRSKGIELGASGNLTNAWDIAAGAAFQRAEIKTATSASAAGATVPIVPARSFSLWNKYSFSPRFAAGLGAVHQSKMFAAIDNKVTLPAFTRFDAALFARITHVVKAQVNLENVFDVKYFPTAHNNVNISPGSPRELRISLTAMF